MISLELMMNAAFVMVPTDNDEDITTPGFVEQIDEWLVSWCTRRSASGIFHNDDYGQLGSSAGS